ncbi:Hypothetical_protein [Hexamita inflata]|uniref:Hypothetical_protein n=1 Tax=Hexamita inflata TaxID=28002 RepID=A0AA86UZ89_9EUKA|nr:Hypothetical protein HINF_LOCUS57976 [Hexamita inflata]
MRLGLIGYGRQNRLKVLSCHQHAFWKAVTFLRNADGTTQVDSRIDRLARSSRVTPPGCLYPSRWLPWLRRCAQCTQVCLKLMIRDQVISIQLLYSKDWR